MNTPYYTDTEVKEKIDAVLRSNASMFTRLGKNTSIDERERAKKMEKKNLRRVHHLDPEKIERLLSDE